jgi:arsenate reductase
MNKKTKILFLCTGNSCRSQMAEGWAKKLKPDTIEAYSAGIEKKGLNPLAVRAMAEAGVDIIGQTSKTIDELTDKNVDYVITLCGHANETCPMFYGPVKRVHAGFDDPPELAKNEPTDEAAMAHYRRVRDEIRDFVAGIPGNLAAS